ncbi:DBR1-domain-containing protein, partial [Hortaea werneckii]
MEPELKEEHGVRLAIEGCGHGTLHAIYASVDEACKRKGWPGVDLLIIGGDFQSVRNAYDLNCVSMSAKYRSMCDFHEYYSGQRTAPYLTIFVGGNHEASNYLFELHYGGWVAPNIFYMGAANVVRLGPLRIAGMSGIWKGYNYRKPHHERLPYNESDMKSIYHTREVDVRKLLQIQTQVDIGISHDWPKGVEWKGNFRQLFRFKKHLEEDARAGQLGNVAAQYVLDRLRPRYWFSAHLHCKYAAVVQHNETQAHERILSGASTSRKNGDEIDLEGDNKTAHGNEAPPKNDAEIDLDMDEDVEPAANTKNTDEIDLELEDNMDAAPSHGIEKPEIATESKSMVNGPDLTIDEAKAALPESFRKPAAP